MTALAEIQDRLDRHRPRRVLGRHWMTRCGVAVLLDETADQQTRVLLMRRAKRAGDPWSGDMSFPGGRMSAPDGSPFKTAMRETAEEIGVEVTDTDYLGRLSDVITRKHEHWRPMIVTPHVFRIPQSISTRLNHEAVETIQVPLAFFAQEANREQMHWRTGRVTWEMPCFFYQDRRIWGLTLLMLRELIQLAHGSRWQAMRLHFGSVEGDVISRKP